MDQALAHDAGGGPAGLGGHAGLVAGLHNSSCLDALVHELHHSSVSLVVLIQFSLNFITAV